MSQKEQMLILVLSLFVVTACGGMKGGAKMSASYAAEYGGEAQTNLEIDDLGVDELWIVARDEMPVEEYSSTKQKKTGLMTEVDGKQTPLPLKSTEVKARIDAYLATVQVSQRYHNPYDAKIEVVYVFPLPQDAAVSEFFMKIGKRTIRGIIKEREEAEAIYQQARDAGYTASLLTQERPNIFTQKVANIEPGHEIDIDLTYFNALPYRDGSYVFSFPSVVGPRFNPPGTPDPITSRPASEPASSNTGTSIPYYASGEMAGVRFSMSIELEAGVEIERIDSPSHALDVVTVSPSRRKIALRDKSVELDKDFVLKYTVAGKQIKSSLFTYEKGGQGYFAFILTPPDMLKEFDRSPVEHVFVLDCSGSMNGEPLDIAKDTVRRVLRKLNAKDSFQIIRFSNRASHFGPRPVPATSENVEKGLRYLKGLHGTGGTMMIEGLRAALDFPHDEDKVRIVTFLTDGFIGNETEILRTIHHKLGAAKIFSFGVGSAPNRYLLEQMAKMGQGAVAYVNGDASETRDAVDAFYGRLSHPALSNISVNWGDSVSEVYPKRIPDLWSGRPIVVTGKFSGEMRHSIVVQGRIGGLKESFEVNAMENENSGNLAIKQIWARMKIMSLSERMTWTDDASSIVSSIRRVALAYNLMSKFTAFVAVDSTHVTAGDYGYTVAQPVPVPAGVRYENTVSTSQEDGPPD